jgi:light-regulated signal transduction histidine kinase (bacteriophytochrome)
MSDETWQRRLDREREARKQAELLLERKSLELFRLNQTLQHMNQNLERLVLERTRELENANTALHHEVHVRELAELALRRGSAELQVLNADLEEFAYVISHDLQEPLRKVNIFAQLLREKLGEKLDEQSQDYLVRLSAAAERMYGMVRDLLELSRAGTHREQQRNVLPDVLLQRVLGDLEPALRESGAKIDAAPLPPVHAAPVQVEQLLRNLLSNALKYRDPERRLEIKIDARTVHGGMVEITVQDNGTGFEQLQAEQIFRPFNRLTRREEVQGTGIGLAICKKIVERHGGRIAAEGIPGQGATFRLTLPVARETP